MKAKGIQGKIMTSRLTLLVVMAICVILWSIYYSSYPPLVSQVTGNSYLSGNFNTQQWGPILNAILSSSVYIIICYLLVELNNHFDIFHVKPSIYIAVYLSYMALFPKLYAFSFVNISAIAVVLSLSSLFSSYQCRYSSNNLFYSFFILSLGSLCFPQLLYFIPIWFIGAIMLQSLHIRSFFGALIGICLPYWFLLAIALYLNKIDLFYAPFIEMVRFGDFNIITHVSFLELFGIIFLAFLFIISLIHCVTLYYDNKIRTRLILYFIILLNIFILAFIILQPVYEKPLLFLFLPGVAGLTCLLFLQVNTKFSRIFFVLMLLIILSIYIINATML